MNRKYLRLFGIIVILVYLFSPLISVEAAILLKRASVASSKTREVWPSTVGGLAQAASLATWGRQVIDADKGDQTVFVLPGDLDGDGDQDVASGAAWYQNPGYLTGVWTKITIGSPLNQVVLVRDLDSDGDLDLLGTQGVGTAINSNFAWAQNNGSGSFTVRTNISAGDGDFLQGVAVGNFGGGNLEVALSWHEGGKGVQVLTVPDNPVSTVWGYRKLNNTGGQQVGSQDEALSAGDIDRDGDTDILTGTRWLERTGSSWTERVLYSPTGAPDRNKLADINQDGRLDAVVGYEAISVTGKLAWYEQSPTATDLWTERLIAQVVGPMSLDVADMDEDGDLDVVVGEHNLSDPGSSKLFVFENIDGTGGAWTPRLVHTGDEHHDGAQTADFDLDGDLDIVSIGWQNPRIEIYDNKSQATAMFDHVVIDNGGLSDIWLKTVGDLNGDGRMDLVAGGNVSGGLVWYQSPSWTKRTIASSGAFVTDGEAVDVDSDGDQDLVILTAGAMHWYENPSWTAHMIGNQGLHDVEISDFDGDGDVDLVTRGQSSFGGSGATLNFYRQDSPTVWTHRAVNCAAGEGLKVVDVDRDGDQDVAINASWFENTRNIINGTWTAYPYTSTWTHPHTFVGAGDVNGDGRVDLILSPAEYVDDSYRISWFEAPANPKSGNWPERIVENNVQGVHHYVGAADMDNDGDVDITTAEMEQGSDPDEVKIYLNQNGSGGVWVKQVVATTGSHSMRIVDVDNDGDQDLYGANWEGNQVELWVNQTFDSTPELATDTTGVFRPTNGALYLKNSNTTGFADIQINYGLGGDHPVVGDWDGDGDVTIGIYRNGSFYLRNSNTIGFADVVFPFGVPGDQPIAGDWDGDGDDNIGVYRRSTGTFLLRNSNNSGAPDMVFALGIAGDIGIAGDWDGDGDVTTGVFRPSNGALYLKNTNVTGFADIQINYGIAGDKPVTGDWDGDGDDTIGVYRNGTFYLRNSNTIGFADWVFGLGVPGDHPIAGNWDGLP